jgi:hypothetical protein
VWFAWRAENDEIEVPKKSAETGGHRKLSSTFKGMWTATATKLHQGRMEQDYGVTS